MSTSPKHYKEIEIFKENEKLALRKLKKAILNEDNFKDGLINFNEIECKEKCYDGQKLYFNNN